MTASLSVYFIRYSLVCAYRSARRSTETIGIINTPQKKLLTPCRKSHGSPATIHAAIPSRLSPNKTACTGAYSVPNKNPCTAHTAIYTIGWIRRGIFFGSSITKPQSTVHRYK